MSSKNKLIRTTSLIIFCTFISKVMGLLRDIFTASKFGTSANLDAFFAASNIPMILFITIGAALTTTLIPLYNQKLSEGKKEAERFINNVLNTFIVVTVVISLICIIFSKYIVLILNPGFAGEQLYITQKLTIILIPTLIFNAVIYIFNGVLQSENNFTAPALVAIPFNLLIIIYLMVYGYKQSIVGLTVITGIATFIQIIPLMVYMKKSGYKYKFFIDLKDPMLKKMGIMLIPVILGSGVQQINSFIERGIATKYGTGSLSALSYGYRIFALFIDVFVLSLAIVIYPQMSKDVADNAVDKMKSTLVKSMKLIIVFILPMSIIIILQSKPIIYVLLERGAFNRESTIITANVLLFYAIGSVAIAIRDMVCKGFYALKYTKTPMINSAIAMVVNILLIFIFKNYFGFMGIPLASAVTMYITCFLLIFSLVKKIGSFDNKDMILTVTKSIIASVIMTVSIIYLNKFLVFDFSSTVIIFIKLVISSLVGYIIYVLIAFVLGINEIKQIVELRKFPKK